MLLKFRKFFHTTDYADFTDFSLYVFGYCSDSFRISQTNEFLVRQ